MKALVKSSRARGAVLQEVPVPSVGHNDVLVKVRCAGICGTDMQIYKWTDWAEGRVRPPYVFGHEFSGTVVEIGQNVHSVKLGDEVAAETHIVCGHCPPCRRGDHHVCLNTEIIGVDRDGCFAEYIALPAHNVWPKPSGLPFELAAVMEPLGNGIHTVFPGPCNDVSGKTVAVVGCGPIGLMVIAILKFVGAANIIALDVSDYRLALAKQLGASVINSAQSEPTAEVYALTNGLGVEVVLEMSGYPQGIQTGFAIAANGSVISMLGIPTQAVLVDVTKDIVFKGVTIYGIAGRKMFGTWEKTTRLLESGLNIRPIVTHEFALEDFAHAFNLMESGNCGKIIFNID